MPYPDYLPYQRKRKNWFWILIAASTLILAAILLYQVPFIHRRVSWRLHIAYTYLQSVISPAGELPTPAVKIADGDDFIAPSPNVPTETHVATATIQATATPMYTPTATLVPTPIPAQLQLTPPAYDEVRDKQDLNNCGPATLALYLRYYGWSGNQYDISKIIKPKDEDANVNVEELVYYVRNYSGWLQAEFRVGGDLDLLKKLIAAGTPVMIEETFITDRQYRLDDDQWAGHYLLITGYDDAVGMFTVHDSELGPNQRISYEELDEHWQSFNRVYILVYPPEKEDALKSVLGENWDVDTNRQNAMETAQQETQADPQNKFAWFNLGSNLTYFERYDEAAQAYDTARTLGLPQRMLRYQFGPFISYFHTFQIEELLTLTKYALSMTRTSEEAMLWRGWAFYRQGDKSTALNYFRDALKIRPDYSDALSAIEYVTYN